MSLEQGRPPGSGNSVCFCRNETRPFHRSFLPAAFTTPPSFLASSLPCPSAVRVVAVDQTFSSSSSPIFRPHAYVRSYETSSQPLPIRTVKLCKQRVAGTGIRDQVITPPTILKTLRHTWDRVQKPLDPGYAWQTSLECRGGRNSSSYGYDRQASRWARKA